MPLITLRDKVSPTRVGLPGEFRTLPERGMGFPGGSVVKNQPTNAGDAGSILGSGRSPGGGNGKPVHYSCLENPLDRGAWQAAVSRGCKESDAFAASVEMVM